MPNTTNISIEKLTEKQSLLLSQLPYVEITQSATEKIKSDGMKLTDLKDHLLNPNDPTTGYLLGTKQLTDKVLGADRLSSDQDLLQNIIDAGLGELVLKDHTIDPVSGFGALTLSDANNNKGIVFRGSDFEYSKGAFGDWLCADIGEHFAGLSHQSTQAIDYFQRNSKDSKNRFLFGFSLGGNLTAHVFNKFHSLVNKAFVFNGNPIDHRRMDHMSLHAFRSQKYACFIKEGDIVGMTKNIDPFKDNVKIVVNPNQDKSNIVSAHQAETTVFDKNGKFIRSTWENAEQILTDNPLRKAALVLVQSMSDIPNRLEIAGKKLLGEDTNRSKTEVVLCDHLKRDEECTQKELAIAIVASKKLPLFADFGSSCIIDATQDVDVSKLNPGDKIGLAGTVYHMMDKSLTTNNAYIGEIISHVCQDGVCAVETENAILISKDIEAEIIQTLKDLNIDAQTYINDIEKSIIDRMYFKFNDQQNQVIMQQSNYCNDEYELVRA